VKPLQLIAVLFTLVACLSLVSWFMTQPVLLGTTKNARTVSPEKTGAEDEGKEEGADHSHDETDKEHHKTNPFKAATGEKLPKLEIVEKEFNFSRMALGATGEHDFVVKNVGTAPAKIARGPVQCKCTVAGLKDQEIPPGEEIRIHLAWTPKDIGPFSQSATIWSNDPDNLEIKLIVTGELFPEVNIAPQNGWSLGPISTSEKIPLIGFIESAVYNTFKITEIVKSSDRVQMEAIAYTENELQERAVLSGYHLRGHLVGIETPQPISELITVHTDLKNLPKFELPVNGTRTGSITIIGSNWYSGNRLLDLGMVSTGKGKEVKLTVMTPPAEEELKLLEVKANPGFLSATLKPEQVGKELARERYSLFVKVPPDSPKGVWPEGTPGTLLLKTNHPLVPELEIKIELTVE